MIKVQGLITTRPRAVITLALTGLLAFLRLRPVTWGRPLPWTWMYAGILPTWAVVIINVVFYGYVIWLGVVFALSAVRKEEKVIWMTVFGNIILAPIRELFPKISGTLRRGQTGLTLLAFLAAMALFASFWGRREGNEER